MNVREIQFSMAENGCEGKRDEMELREKQESDPGRVSMTWFN